jgi:tRNA (cmo5U34)-methyltransferase
MPVSSQGAADFDARPPVPVGDYDATARGVNPGYALAFELAAALLRAHCPADARILLVGGGGSTEVRAVGAAGPRWRLTAVDPSADMLALARIAAEAAGLGDRVEVVRGTPDDLPRDEPFDAATALFVLMHVPDDGGKLRLLRGIAARLEPGAPLILVDAVADRRARFAPAWREYAVARGVSAAWMADFLARVAATSHAATEARELALLGEAGFRDATRFFAAFHVNGWIATR